MADSKKNNKPFVPTYLKYTDMTDREKACFRQGANTVTSRVKENLGLKKPKR
jgi:hypothetical protein